jgi:hypothetical protein
VQRAMSLPWRKRAAISDVIKCVPDLMRFLFKQATRMSGPASLNAPMAMTLGAPANPYFISSAPMSAFTPPHWISTDFNWGDKEDNKDIKDKILGFASARLVRKCDSWRYLPEELLPQGMDEDSATRCAHLCPETIQTLIIERPRHDILSHGPGDKLTVTFSNCVDRDWWGFDKYAKEGWPLDKDAVCADMDLKQTVTDVTKILLPHIHGQHLAADEWHVEVVRQGEDGEDIVRIGKDSEKIVIDYKLHDRQERWAFERRLREKLHLRHLFVDGVDEFSVERIKNK